MIRPQQKSDDDAVDAVNQAAFGQPGEARLVRALAEDLCVKKDKRPDRLDCGGPFLS